MIIRKADSYPNTIWIHGVYSEAQVFEYTHTPDNFGTNGLQAAFWKYCRGF